VAFHALDSSTNVEYDATSGSDGTATFKLEKGTCDITATWNGVNVGETSIVVNGDSTFTIYYQLTNVEITVKSSNGIAMPLVNLNIVYHYQNNVESKTGSASGQTDSSGCFTFKLKLSKYNLHYRCFNLQSNFQCRQQHSQ
jgi:hypothetical protein